MTRGRGGKGGRGILNGEKYSTVGHQLNGERKPPRRKVNGKEGGVDVKQRSKKLGKKKQWVPPGTAAIFLSGSPGEKKKKGRRKRKKTIEGAAMKQKKRK